MHPFEYMMEGLAQAWANNWEAAFPPPKEYADETITAMIDRELANCTLIGPAAGAELRALVYG